MQTMARESWTDERLDEFGKRMDERFDRVEEKFAEADKRIDAVRREMNQQFNRIGNGLETVQRALIFGSITMSTAFVAGFLTLAVKL